MFGHFIYFILVLLIYLTYQPSTDTFFSAFDSFALFVCLVALFTLFTRFQFQRIEKRIARGHFLRIDNQFNNALLHQSIMAVLLYAVDIYGLNLPSFVATVPPFSTVPTLAALLFLLLFVFYLVIVWTFAYGPYQMLYHSGISRRTYVISNITFSVPVLLPWLFLSGILDIIQALPFELPRRLLNTTEGQVTYFLIFLMAVAIIGPALVQKFWRCKPLEDSDHRSRIESLCRRAGMGYANILYWPIFGGKMITAGVMGLVKKFRYILVTPSLLTMLQPEEIDAVVAHEIGHIKKKHLLFYLVFFVGYMLLSYVTFDFMIFAVISTRPVFWLINQTGLSQTTVISAISSILIILVFLIYFRFIFGYYMRNFERQADTYVYALFDSAQPLITTLEKIAAASGQSADKPNWHHFSIRQRIDYLRKCEASPSWIARHEGKVRKSIGVYLVCMVCLGVLGYQLNVGSMGEKISMHFLQKVILQQIEQSPDNPNLYSLLGNIYYNTENWEGVQNAWEKSLALEPDNAQVLNNLAWHYAACENKRYRNPARALAMAQLAIRLDKLPHVWDTLAESYYVNGMYSEAVKAAEQALAMATKRRTYYAQQLEKFKNAATTGVSGS